MIRVVGVVSREGEKFVPSPPHPFFTCVQSSSSVVLEPAASCVAKSFTVRELDLRRIPKVTREVG